MISAITLFGIKACDTCRAAKQALEKAEYSVDFIDVRETPLSAKALADLYAQFGDALLNKRSTTWRNLGETERDEAVPTLISGHPTLMKRPVIVGEITTIGWDKAAQAAHLG